MRFKEYILNEEYNYDNLSDNELLREAIREEYYATNVYTQMEKKTSNPKLKEVFRHLAEEEMVHIEEFKQMLRENEDYINTVETQVRKELEKYLG